MKDIVHFFRNWAVNNILDLDLDYICKHNDISTVEELLEYLRANTDIPSINYTTLGDLRDILEFVFRDKIEISERIIHFISWKD